MKTLQQQLDEIINTGKRKKLLLHGCCAPCSSYVLEYLAAHFDITVLYYNPNIMPEDEYYARLNELEKLIDSLGLKDSVTLLAREYNPEEFLDAVKGFEDEPEGGTRCDICFEMRLREAAVAGKNIGADYFTTSLSISPHKNSKKLDEIALKLQEEYGILRLPSDFKKKGGYLRSVELSKQFELYRQDWCGCPFSKAEHDRKYNTED